MVSKIDIAQNVIVGLVLIWNSVSIAALVFGLRYYNLMPTELDCL